jgi:hypothetical protein
MGRQFVIQLDNRPGELAHLARALGARGIDIEHISCAGTGSIACAFMTTGEPGETREVLHGLGHDFIEGETIVVDVEDRPGGLADIAEKLARAGVNILHRRRWRPRESGDLSGADGRYRLTAG